MKCFIIKSGEEYIADGTRAISRSYYNGRTLNTTPHMDEAKHYNSPSVAKSWLKKTIHTISDDLESGQNELQESKSHNPTGRSWTMQRIDDNIKNNEITLKWLQKATVESVEVETPNYSKKYKITWDKWRKHLENHGKGRMSIEISKVAKYSCISCGIRLKDIPYYNIDKSRVCIPCLHLRHDAIEAAFLGMDEEFRNDITNELILANL